MGERANGRIGVAGPMYKIIPFPTGRGRFRAVQAINCLATIISPYGTKTLALIRHFADAPFAHSPVRRH
jgi:hypothetical protein